MAARSPRFLLDSRNALSREGQWCVSFLQWSMWFLVRRCAQAYPAWHNISWPETPVA